MIKKKKPFCARFKSRYPHGVIDQRLADKGGQKGPGHENLILKEPRLLESAAMTTDQSNEITVLRRLPAPLRFLPIFILDDSARPV